MKFTAGIKTTHAQRKARTWDTRKWFIVWSYTEKADFQQRHLPSGFPFSNPFNNTVQLLLRAPNDARKYPFDFGRTKCSP